MANESKGDDEMAHVVSVMSVEERTTAMEIAVADVATHHRWAKFLKDFLARTE